MSFQLRLRIAVWAVPLISGALLAFGGDVAHAGYVHAGSFRIGNLTEGLAVDQSTGNQFSGDVYAAVSSGPLEQFNESGTLITTFGVETSGVAVDPSTHDVYAYAPSNAQVDEFDPSTGQQIGTIGAGTITPGGQLRIWADPSGDVFVPVREKNIVDEFNSSGALVREIGAGALNEPVAVALDSAGNMYVLDHKPSTAIGRVQELSPTGTLEGVLGEGSLSNAFGITVDTANNDVFVVDQGEGATPSKVNQFGPSQNGAPGTLITTFGSGEVGSSLAIAVNPVSEDVYVAEVAFLSEAKIFIPAQGPEATTLGSEAVTATHATLNGTVNPHGFPTHWHFEFGLNKSYGEDSPALPGPETGIATGVQTQLTGLEPNATYDYQLVANNQNGTAEGGDRTVTTLSARPSVHGQQSLAVTRTGASVSALINPNNQDTHYFFQYGTDMSYSLGSVPASPGEDIGTKFGDQSREASLSGLQPNMLYHYRVVAVNATGTTEGVDQTFTTLPNATSATTGAASGVGQSAATLTGIIDPQGAETSYYFEYSGPGTFSIVTGKAGSGSGATPVTTPVNGLSPGVTYQYRLIATNAGGTTIGSYQTFTTAPPPPSGPPAVVTGGTSNLTPSSATLGGIVNPNGGATSYQFQYGTSAAYGASLPEASAGAGAEPQGVAAGLSGLAPGTTYHYRLVATNAAGTSYGADQAFTTPASPVSAFGPLPMNTLAPTTTTKPTTPKPLTRAQKLSKALKACKKDKSKAKRAKCEKEARKKYGTKAKKKK
jgi:hypothetical protein